MDQTPRDRIEDEEEYGPKFIGTLVRFENIVGALTRRSNEKNRDFTCWIIHFIVIRSRN